MAPPKVRFDFEMRDLQRYITMMCHKIPYILIAVDMSLGKTAAVLQYLRELLLAGKARRVLVVAPKRVASDTWPDEFRLWYQFRDMKRSIIVGTPEERRRALRKKAYVYVINKENLAWLWEELNNGKDWDFDTLIVDESSMLKEGKKRTIRAGGGKGSRPLSRFGIISRARKMCKRVVLMTGTPAPEGIHNMWGQIYVLDLGERLGASKDAFERRWINKGFKGWGTDPFPGAEEEIIRLSSDLMISLTAEDHLKLPPVITTPDTDIWVDLPPAARRAYKQMRDDLYAEDYDVEAFQASGARNKLCQLANGSMYKSKNEAVFVHNAKLDALEELIDSLNGQHLLIAWSYQFDREAIRKRFGKKVVHLNEAGKNVLRDWNNGKIVNLATHPLSISHGTNLQYGGFNTVWYGLHDSGETYRQFNKRLPRPGQRNSHVFIRHILARNTEDIKILNSQDFKKSREDLLRSANRVTKEDIDRALAR